MFENTGALLKFLTAAPWRPYLKKRSELADVNVRPDWRQYVSQRRSSFIQTGPAAKGGTP